MKIQIKTLDKNTVIPKQATEFSGGWDVTVTRIEKKSEDLVVCYLGFALGIPKGFKATFVPRSSLTKTNWILQNSPCLGDSDYIGEYQLRFRGLPEYATNGVYIFKFKYPEFPYVVGDRVGQMYVEEVIPIEWEEVKELEQTKRGDGGFGSTNK